MRRNRQNNGYRTYVYLPPSVSTSPLNTHYQYYDRRLRTRQSFYSNTTSTARFTSPCLQQQQLQSYKPTTTISDLAEPISVFGDLTFPSHHQLDVIPFPSVYRAPYPTRPTLVNDAPLVTANTIRQRLLLNIQRNIHEIDQELSSLEPRPIMPRYIPPRLSFIDRKTHSSNENKQMWTNKSKRVYEVIPRITGESKMTSHRSTPNLMKQAIPQRFVGQYHYGPEVEEAEIAENDPENCELKSTADELRELSVHETLSFDQFRREQSDGPQNRASIFVPEYVDNNETSFSETTKDSSQNNPTDTNIVQPSAVSSARSIASPTKLNIQDSADNNEPFFSEIAKDSPQNDPTDTNIVQPSTVSSARSIASPTKLNIQDSVHNNETFFSEIAKDSPQNDSTDTNIAQPSAVNSARSIASPTKLNIQDSVDNNETFFSEIAKDSPQNNPTDTTDTIIVPPSAVSSARSIASSTKLNIQDSEQLIHVTSEPKTEIPSRNTLNPDEFSYKSEEDFSITVFPKLIKHFCSSTKVVTDIEEEEVSSSGPTVISQITVE